MESSDTQLLILLWIFMTVLVYFCEKSNYLWTRAIFLWIFEIISIFIIIRSKMVPKMFPWASWIRLEIVFDESRARCLYFLWNHWIFCEQLSIFCEFYEITDNPIIIHNRMIVWTQFVYLETMFDEFGEQCLIFLWNHWIICEKISFFVIFSKFQVNPQLSTINWFPESYL